MDPDQMALKPSDLDLQCFQKKINPVSAEDKSCFSRTRVNSMSM